MQRKDSFKGIPEQHRAQVKRYLKVCRDGKAKIASTFPQTPQAAYRSLKAGWKEQAEKKAAEGRTQEQRKADLEKEGRAMAARTVNKAMRNLPLVSERLHDIETNDVADHINEAIMLRALVESLGRDLEQSLFDLGIYEGNKYGRTVEGYFVEVLKK